MPKLAPGLSDTRIRNAKPKDKQYKLADGKGLVLLVNPNGSKWWRLRYSIDGSEKMLSLGVYPEVSLTLARQKTNDARKSLANGSDPSQDRKSEKRKRVSASRDTFKAVAEEWYLHKSKSWAKETARKARETLDDYLFPKLASKPIAEISTSDIKPAILYVFERGPRLAVKARQYCNQIIDYAIQEGLREDGRLLSLRGVLPKAPKSHYAAVTKSSELPALFNAINAIGSNQSRTAILCCLYTALRPGVVAGALWNEFDFEKSEWHISADRMKMGNDHITPIPSQMLELLKEQREMAGDSPFVFPGIRNPNIQHVHRDTLSKILRESGLRGVTVTHGFRATLRTIAREELGIDKDVLEAQLAHAKKDEIQAAYDRTQFLKERHDLMQRWADYLNGLAKGENVISFKVA